MTNSCSTKAADATYIERAKEQLYQALAAHPDEGVRALNDMIELTDDDPAVLTIAKALEAKDTKATKQ